MNNKIDNPLINNENVGQMFDVSGMAKGLHWFSFKSNDYNHVLINTSATNQLTIVTTRCTR